MTFTVSAEEELDRIRDVVERYPYIALVRLSIAFFVVACMPRLALTVATPSMLCHSAGTFNQLFMI